MRISDWRSDVCSSDLLALAGALLAEGNGDTRRVSPIWKEFAPGIIAVIAQATHDEEGVQTRIEQSVESTLQKIARGKPTQGWPTLAEHLSEDVVQRCKDFVFGVEEAAGHVRPIAGEQTGRASGRERVWQYV